MFDDFRNNVFCRRESNQIKAEKLWEKISGILLNSDKVLFEIEWRHYIMGEINSDEFSFYITKYVKKYFN